MTVSHLPESIIAATLDADCDCKTCDAVRAILEESRDTLHEMTYEPGCTPFLQLIYRAKCIGCGWRGEWRGSVEQAQGDYEQHADHGRVVRP